MSGGSDGGMTGVDAGRPGALDRRTLMTGAALAGGAAGLALLAGCADPAADPSTVGPSRDPGVPPAPGPPPDPSGGGGASGTHLGPASEVPVGGGRIFPAYEVVVTQPTVGKFFGFTTVCTHTACNVTRVDRTIDCPCHGSRFHLDGSVANGPAPRPLPARPVTVVDGQIVLS